MTPWFTLAAAAVAALLVATGAFFFATTRGTLLVRSLLLRANGPADHVYPIYSNMRLMRMVDFQPIIAAILLFQYDRLVSIITAAMRRMDLRGRDVLITSCAFGNVMPRIVAAGHKAGSRHTIVADIIENELIHAEGKLRGLPGTLALHRQDAAHMELPDGSVSVNVLFFLLHELPHDLKGQVLKEAWRVLAPGGKLFLAEFHRPRLGILRVLSWTYFKVFEPLGLALWDTHEPIAQLRAMDNLAGLEQTTVCFGNYQVVVATKRG